MKREKMSEEDARQRLQSYTPVDLLGSVEGFRFEGNFADLPYSFPCPRCNRNPVFASDVRKHGLTVCYGCCRNLDALSTHCGRLAVEEAIVGLVPAAYRRCEFGTFIAYNRHLEDIAARIIEWSRCAVHERHAGSLYVWSGPGPHGEGNGNGKTHLSLSSFKFAARRRSLAESDHSKSCGMWADLRTYACDLNTHLIQPAYAEWQRGNKLLHTFDYNQVGDCITGSEVPVEQIADAIGRCKLLYLDDVGAGSFGNAGRKLYERILDIRATDRLPTFMTSNYSPAQLNDRIGSRAVSRLSRNDCEVIEVKAPDFSTIRPRIRRVDNGTSSAQHRATGTQMVTEGN